MSKYLTPPKSTLRTIPLLEILTTHYLRLHKTLLLMRLLDIMASECIAHLLTYLLEKSLSLLLLLIRRLLNWCSYFLTA